MGAQFTLPLITVIPGQLIASALWNNEWLNLNTNFVPLGMDSYSNTDAAMQTQTNPYPGNVTSHASSLGGEIERIRYQISQIIGNTFWYQPPPLSIVQINNIILPLGGIFEYHSSTPPSANFLYANGVAISRTTYAGLNALYAAAGYPFGAGDGLTTFNLPNYGDRVSVGAGNIYTVGQLGGEATHLLTTAEIPAVTVTDPGHAHGITDPTHAHEEAATGVGQWGTGGTHLAGTFTGTTTAPEDKVSAATTGITVNSGTTGITVAGGGLAHNNLQPYIGMFKMIRVL